MFSFTTVAWSWYLFTAIETPTKTPFWEDVCHWGGLRGFKNTPAIPSVPYASCLWIKMWIIAVAPNYLPPATSALTLWTTSAKEVNPSFCKLLWFWCCVIAIERNLTHQLLYNIYSKVTFQGFFFRVCMRESDRGEREGGKKEGGACTCVETKARSLLLFLPWYHTYWPASFQVILLFPIWRCQCWYYRCGPLHQAFYMGFRTHSNHQSDLHHEGLYPLSLLTSLEILFVVLVIEVRARQIPLPVSHIPIQLYFFIWNHKI